MKLLSLFRSFQSHPSFFLGLLFISLSAMEKKSKKHIKRSENLCKLIKKGKDREVIKLIMSHKKLTKKQKETREALNTCNEIGELPLNLVILQGKFSLLTIILNAEANCNAVDALGNTALHQLLLVYSTFIEKNQWSEWQTMFNYLIENSSPNVELSNEANKTILDLVLDLVRETNHRDENYKKITGVFRRVKRLAHSLNSSASGSGDTDSPTPSIADEIHEGFEFEICPIANINNLIKANNIPELNKELYGQHLKDVQEKMNHIKKMVTILNGFDVTGTLPLNLIIMLKRSELFNRVIKEKELDINAFDGSGNTPLHTIVRMRQDNKDIDKNSPSWTELRLHKKREIELMFDSWRKMFCAIKALHPDPNIENNAGETALDLAIDTRRLRLVKVLLGLGADPTRGLISAVQQLKPGMIRLFLNNGATHSSIDDEGNTLLHTLILNYKKLDTDKGTQLSQWLATFEALLSANPDLSRFNLKGETPLHLGVETQNLQVVQSLVKAKADVHAYIDGVLSPFDLANGIWDTQEFKKEKIAEKQQEFNKGSKRTKKNKSKPKSSYSTDGDSYRILMLLKKHGDISRNPSQSFDTSSWTSSFGSSSGTFGSYGSPPSLNPPPHPPSFYGVPGFPFTRLRTSSMSHSLPQLPTVSSSPVRKNSVEKLFTQSNDSSKGTVAFKKESTLKKEELRSQLAKQLKQESEKSKMGRRPLEMRNTDCH